MLNKQKRQIPPPPVKPDPHECCGSGCTPCIFDYYEIALDKWKEKYAIDYPRTGVEEHDQTNS